MSGRSGSRMGLSLLIKSVYTSNLTIVKRGRWAAIPDIEDQVTAGSLGSIELKGIASPSSASRALSRSVSAAR